jgi:hypothetical protein
MKISRNIQLISVAVIANGGIALAIMNPIPAFAATCTPSECAAIQSDETFFCQLKYGPGVLGTHTFCPHADGTYLITCSNGLNVVGGC